MLEETILTGDSSSINNLVKQELYIDKTRYNIFHAIAEKISLHTNRLITECVKNTQIPNYLLNMKIKDNAFGNTPLHIFITNELNKEAILFLEEISKNKRLIHETIDSEGKTQLILATKTGQEDVALKILDIFTEIEIDKQDKDGRTALHYACILGCKKLIIRLVELGASMDIKDLNNTTPFAYLLKTPDNIICDILKAVCIDYNRAYNANFNYILDENCQPLMVINNKLNVNSYDINAIKNKTLENLKKNLLDENINFIDSNSLISAKSKKDIKHMSMNKRKKIIKYIDGLSEKSLLQKIKENRIKMLQSVKKIGIKLQRNTAMIDFLISKTNSPFESFVTKNGSDVFAITSKLKNKYQFTTANFFHKLEKDRYLFNKLNESKTQTKLTSLLK
jgi:ankyrin repeat protein